MIYVDHPWVILKLQGTDSLLATYVCSQLVVFITVLRLVLPPDHFFPFLFDDSEKTEHKRKCSLSMRQYVVLLAISVPASLESL